MTTRAMPYTFADLIYQYDASKYMLRRQIITRAEHNRTIRSLNVEQEKRDVAEQLRQLAVRTAEAEKRKAEKRKAYNQRRKDQRAKPKSNTASVEPFKQTMMRWLNGEEKENESLRFELPEDMLQRIQLKDKMTVQFDLVNGSDVLDSFSTTVNGKDISSIVHHYNYSDKVIGLKTDKKSQTRSITSMADIIMRSSDLRMTVFQPIIAKMKKQAFRDGVDHCFFLEIIKHFEELVKEATVTKTKRNRQAIVNKLKKMIVQYDKGVPEEIVESVAYELDIGVIIHSISHHKLIAVNLKPKNKKFEFINSRMNHVEYITIAMNSEPVMITKEEGIQLITDHIKNKLYNYYSGTITNPCTILTTTQRYIVGDKLSTALFDFTKSFDRGCMLDYIREKELCDFILSGTHLMINYKNMKCKGSPVAEIDMKKAYTQFKHCSVYQGFPAIINNVRDCDSNHDVVAHNGVYQVSIVSMVKTIQNAKKIELLHAYGFKENGSYVLASPWIVKLREIGCIVHVLFGAWGKRMDFSFSQEMMDEKLYAIWTGMQMKRDDELHFKMACDSEFAEVVMAQHTEGNVEYNQATQTIMINKKKDYHYIMPHVSAFLVAYTQIAVFDEASKYNVSEIVAHKLDSIVLTRTPLPFDSTLWEDSTPEGIPMNKYTSNFIFSEKYIALTRGLSTPYLGDCFISGQGGSGKTQVIMGDIGFRSKFFVTLSWDLISDKIVEFSSRGASINQLLGFDIYNKKIQSYKDKRGSPGVIALDEMSMTNCDIVRRIKEMYPFSQFIMMGDYDKGKYYQSSLLTEGNQLYHPESYHLITSDFRSIDEETRIFKKEIRSLMDNNESLVGYLYSKIPSLSMEEIKKEYSMDYTMTGTHARIAHFTKELTSDKNWYKVMKHNFEDVIKKCAGSNVYLHGQVLDFPIEGRTELTHAFTVHSFQGKTITDKKCYVDLSHLKCNADIYTAISRVRSIHQLRLVRSEYSSVIFSNGLYFYKN